MKALSGFQKLIIVASAVGVLGAGYFFYSSRAGTEIALTLTTNPDLERGLIGHWTFDGADVDWSSTTAEIRDRSANNNHADIDTWAYAVTPGVLGQAIKRATTTWAEGNIANPTALNIGTGDMTVSAWTKFDTDENAITFFYKKNGGEDVEGINIGQSNTSCCRRVGLLISDGNTHAYHNVEHSNLTGTGWHHVTFVIDRDTETRLYLDGVFYGSTTGQLYNGVDISNTDPAGILLADHVGVNVDDLRIYNRALSDEEIKRLYQLGATTKVAQTLDSNTTLETGLVGHWTFDGNDVDWGSTTAEIRDRSGNNNYANASGGMSATSSPTMGAIGQAIGCDGVSGWVNAGNDSDWQLHTTDSAIAFWMKSDTNHQDSEIIDRGAGGSGPGYLIAFSEPGYRLSSAFYADGGDHVSMGPYTVTPEQWYHVTVVTTLTPKEGKLYINGNLIQTDAYTGNLTDRSEVLSICSDEGGSGNFNGSIDDVRVYNRALSADEVKRLYQLGATTKVAQTLDSNTTLDTGLVGHWTFDGPDFTDKVYDKSGNGNHGYVYGTATSGAKAMGVLGQAVQFDGVDDLIDLGSDSSLDDLYPATYSFWMYPMETANDFGGILTKTVWVIDRQDFDNSLESYNECISNALYGKTPANSVQLNTWQHVTVTLDGTCSSLTTSVQIYINGVLQALTGSTGVTLSADGSYPLQIGKNLLSDPDGFFKGSLDDVRVYNRILSAEEIQRLYELGK